MFLSDRRRWDLVDVAAHKRAVPAKALRRHLQILLDRGIVEPVARDKVRMFLKAFSVPKRKVRLIINAIPVNDLIATIPQVKLPTQADIEALVCQYEMMVELDGDRFINQFPLDWDIARYFGVRIDGKNFLWKTGPMGFKPMPYVAHTATETIAADSRDGTTQELAYIDNVYLFAHRCQDANARKDAFLRSADRGVFQ